MDNYFPLRPRTVGPSEGGDAPSSAPPRQASPFQALAPGAIASYATAEAELDQQLFDACEAENLEDLVGLVESGANPNLLVTHPLDPDEGEKNPPPPPTPLPLLRHTAHHHTP